MYNPTLEEHFKQFPEDEEEYYEEITRIEDEHLEEFIQQHYNPDPLELPEEWPTNEWLKFA